MKPTLFSIGSIQISSFGLFWIISFLLFLYIIWKKAKEKLYSEETVFDGIFFVSFMFFAGARLAYVFLHLNQFGINIFKWILFTNYPGFYFYGGLISALFAHFYFFSKKDSKLPFWEMFDYFVLAFITGYIIIQFGVLLSGLEYGKLTDLFLGVKYLEIDGRRHPVSLYKAMILFIMTMLLLRFKKRLFVRRKNIVHGLFGLCSMFLFSLVNFLVDNLTEGEVYYLRLMQEQWIALFLMLIFIWLIYKKIGYEVRIKIGSLKSKKNV